MVICQACVHPQMVRGQMLELRHETMTMEALLTNLIRKTGLQCDESQRLRVAACNGLGALDVIEFKWDSAAEKYRDVLRYIPLRH